MKLAVYPVVSSGLAFSFKGDPFLAFE